MPFKNPDPIYSIWQGMKRRCLNPKAKQFADYGGRGVSVCERWLNSFANFKADMGDRPHGYSLDRIDNDLGYSPENCRWADRRTQQRNRRNTRLVHIGGTDFVAADLSDLCGVKTDAIVARAQAGLPLEEVLSKKRRVTKVGWSRAIETRVRNQLAKTHCNRGHPYSEENTRITPEGWRNCRACHRDKMRKRKAAGL